MKRIFRTRPRWYLGAALILTGFLIGGYCAILSTHARHPGETGDNAIAEVSAEPEVEEPDSYVAGARPDSVSPEDLAKVRAAARALPRRPLTHGWKFESAAAPSPSLYTSWTAPIPPPLADVYHTNVKNSGRVWTFGFDPSDGNVVYAGGFGGVLKTINANSPNPTWQFISDSWEAQAIGSVVVDPKAASYVYACTSSDYAPYDVGIYRSTDAGSQWTRLSGNCPSCGATNVFEGTILRTLVVDPNSSASGPSSTIYAAADHSNSWSGLWRSTDMGDHWERELTRSFNGIWDMAIDSATSTLYVGDSTGVYQKKQSGSWTLILAPNSNWFKFDQVRLAVVNSVPYVLSPTSAPNFVYKVFYSQTPDPNPPLTWIELPTLLNGTPISPYKFAVDPTDLNGNRVLLGTADFFLTNNKGATWTIIRQQPQPLGDLHVDFYALVYSPTVPGQAYVGNDGGIWKSTQNGIANTWESLNQNLPGSLLYGVALSNDDTMMAGTQDNGSVVRISGSGPWKTILSGDATRALIDPSNSGEYSYYAIFGGGPFRRFKKSTQFDVDMAWPYGSEPCNFSPAFNINPLVPQRLTAGCQRVARTWNGTVSPPVQWQSVGNPFVTGGSTLTAVAEAPSDPNVIYAVEQNSRVWVTRNAGTNPSATPTVTPTWAPVLNLSGINNVTVDLTNPNIAYLACNSGVYKTWDWGTNWFRFGIAGLIYRDLAIDPANSNHLYVASNMGVFKSSDAGGSWEDMSAGIPAGLIVNGLSLNPSTRRMAASTWGRGVYLLDVPAPTPCPSCTPIPTPTPIPPTPTPTPSPTPTPPPTVSVIVSLPVATIAPSVNNFTQPVMASTIDAADNLVGFQGDLSFDSSVVSFQSPPVSPSGLTASNFNVSGVIMSNGPGSIKKVKIFAYANDFVTPLSGAGALFTLNMMRVSSTPNSSSSLSWLPTPDDFEFFNVDLDNRLPSSAPSGSITITAAATVSIAGNVKYCSNAALPPVSGVTMALTGTTSGSASTDGAGNYSFASLTSGGSYTVSPTKTALLPGAAGVSTIDVVAVQRHFLNIVLIPPGCRLIAADVNGDSAISTVDVIAVQRFFLGASTGIANVGKYQFSPANRSYSPLSSDQTNQNYDALVFGDVAPNFVH